MSNEKQETIEDIVREMRSLGRLDERSTDKIPRSLQALGLRTCADRIEAAWMREREVGAEAAQICGEIGEIVGREATCSKSSQVGNADIVREVAQEMLNTSMQAVTAERINGWAVRLAAACEQSVTDCNQMGNAAAIREALVRCADIINKFGLAEIITTPMEVICDIEGIISAALAAPLRNCDVPHKDDHELWLRWQAFCAEIYPSRMSFSTWLLDLAQEGGAK